MGFPKGTRFSTQLLLTNTSSNPITVAATFDGGDKAGSPVFWEAPALTLSPFESRVVDLERVRIEGHSPVADGHVGMRLAHTGKIIDLLAEAVTVDQTLTFSFYDLFFDEKFAGSVEQALFSYHCFVDSRGALHA